MRSRNEVIKLATSWLGKKESDGSYKEIIDIYNSYKGGLPRGVKMQYSWPWCACTWSAIAIKLGYTDIMPIEISCGELINAAKKMGIWVENDAYIPKIGDGILYDWDDSGVGDNTGWPDHTGVIDYVNTQSGYFIVIEGNYNDSVKKRTISINGKYIRGFIAPKYDEEVVQDLVPAPKKDVNTVAHEVIAGVWGNYPERKTLLENNGYNYEEVRAVVNQILNRLAVQPKDPVQNQDQPAAKKVTATCAAQKFSKTVAGTYTTKSDLYCRNDAGTNKKALCLIPAGTKVQCYGYYSMFGTKKWLYIQFVMDGVQYTGFSHSDYLKK